jgi:hypothetical protein
MKLYNIPLDQIVWNPWRDKDIHPIDEDHVKELRESINEHGFFASVKGRRVEGKIQIACGHARLVAARRARLETIPIYIDDIDDDAMLKLMVEENALQAGSGPGAVMNEVAAVVRRVAEALLPHPVARDGVLSQAFENKDAIDTAYARLQRWPEHRSGRQNPIGYETIARYIGPHRSHMQIREALGALVQNGRYEKLIDETIRRNPIPVEDTPSARKADLIPAPARAKPRPPVLDERAAAPFKTETQFSAFRDAVTTSAAQKAIPVKEQPALAREIMRPKHKDAAPKQVTTAYIKAKVQDRVQDYMKQQRKIDKEERDRYLAEQIEDAIDSELFNANRALRTLVSCLMKLEKLADKYPAHPKLGGFSVRLDDLVNAIRQFGKKLK